MNGVRCVYVQRLEVNTQTALCSFGCETASCVMVTVTLQLDFIRCLIKYQYYKNTTFKKLSLSYTG
jgi:hypothetical protein